MENIDKILQMDVKYRSKTKWSSPISLDPNKNCTKRLCIDYRNLKKVTVRDYYPISSMEEFIKSLED